MFENQHIEYKQSWHDDYLKWICGFANASGGVMFIGKKDDGELLNVDHNSRPRNPVIANACFLSGYIDSWGRGTLKIINSCKEYGLPEPSISEKNGGVVVSLFQTDQGGQMGGQMGDVQNQLTIRQKEVLQLIVENTKISRKELAEKLGIN